MLFPSHSPPSSHSLWSKTEIIFPFSVFLYSGAAGADSENVLLERKQEYDRTGESPFNQYSGSNIWRHSTADKKNIMEGMLQ